MSSNLLKSHMFDTGNINNATRIIDSNEFVNKRLTELAEKMALEANQGKGFSDEFTEGIQAEDVTALLLDDNEGTEEADIDINELTEKAMKKAEEIINDAKRQAEDVVNASISQAESAKNEIFERAREEGYLVGRQAAEQEYYQARQQDELRIQQIEEEFNQKEEALEKTLVETITGIYSHIFQTNLEDYRDVLIYLIKSTLRGVNSSKQIVIRVSSEDFAYVNGHRKMIMDQLPSSSVSFEILEDMNVMKRQCMIETESGIFDCGIDTQLEQLRRKLVLLSYEQQDL